MGFVSAALVHFFVFFVGGKGGLSACIVGRLLGGLGG